MSEKQNWDELYEAASREVLRWRKKHKRATLTEIEDTVDAEMARMRAQMIQDLAMGSETADLRSRVKEERPQCPQCGRPLAANGQQRRELDRLLGGNHGYAHYSGYSHICNIIIGGFVEISK